jgi:hypothetical protein
MEIGKKMVMLVGTGLGVAVPRMLEGIDAQLAIDWVKTGKGKDPEAYPLYYRPGIMVPNIAGPVCLLAGVLGDKYLSEDAQIALLTAGTGLTIGGLQNLSTALDGRKKAGVPLMFPDPATSYNSKCAYRSIGGPGYMVGCQAGGAGAGAGAIVDPPYNLVPNGNNGGVRVGF